MAVGHTQLVAGTAHWPAGQQPPARTTTSGAGGAAEASTPSPTLAAYPHARDKESRHTRWEQLCGQLDPRLTEDAYWPYLVRALDRIHDAGRDVDATLPPLFPLPHDHPGRNLHYRLMGVAHDAAEPRPATRHDWSEPRPSRPDSPTLTTGPTITPGVSC